MNKILSTLLGASSVAAATLTLAAATITSAEAGTIKRTIDFDMNPDNISLPAGTQLQGDEWSEWGVNMSVNRKALTVFDSNCEGNSGPNKCSGGDPDLGTAYLGDNHRGNVLIIQEKVGSNQIDSDGLYKNPDDDSNGGIISFDFTSAVTLYNLEFLDYDLAEENKQEKLVLTAYGENGEKIDDYEMRDFAQLLHKPNSNGDNSIWKFDLGSEGLKDVWKLDVNFNGISGAISKVQFDQYVEDETPIDVPEPSAIVSLAFLGGGMFLSRRRKSS